MSRCVFVFALCWMLWCVVPSGVQAADGPQDESIITAALKAALEFQKSGETVPWVNPATGNSGTITVLRTFFRGGESCREYKRTLEQNGSAQDSVTGTGCRNNNGAWTLDEEGPPATVQVAATPAAITSSPEVGDIRRVVVWAYGTPPGQPRKDLYEQDAVFAQELLETPPDGALHVNLQDGGELRLGSASQVRLDEFVYNPDSGAGKVTASIGKGLCRFITGQVKGDDFQVRTPTALIGVRGTDFLVSVALTSFTIVHVNFGSILVTPFGGAAPQVVNAGETLGIGPAGRSTTNSAAAPRDKGIESQAGLSPGSNHGARDGETNGSGPDVSSPDSDPSSSSSSSTGTSGKPRGGEGAAPPGGPDIGEK